MSKKITIIIPVFNGEKYISRCVDSVLNQENFPITDLEIILINDGSKDGSLMLLDEYQERFSEVIQVVDQENVGVAETRNKGILLANGIYVMFIDQDDYVDPDYCATFYKAIESSGSDVVSGGYRRPDSRGVVKKSVLPRPDREFSKYILMAAWAKIHRTEFLQKHNITFFDNRFGEDNVFTVKEICATERWQQIGYVGYNWFYNERSVSNTAQKGLKHEDIQALLRLLDALREAGGNAVMSLVFQYYLFRTVAYYLLFSGRSATSNRFIKAYRSMFGWLHANFPDAKPGKYLLFRLRGETLAARLAVFFILCLHHLGLMGYFAKIYCKKYI